MHYLSVLWHFESSSIIILFYIMPFVIYSYLLGNCSERCSACMCCSGLVAVRTSFIVWSVTCAWVWHWRIHTRYSLSVHATILFNDKFCHRELQWSVIVCWRSLWKTASSDVVFVWPIYWIILVLAKLLFMLFPLMDIVNGWVVSWLIG